MKDVSLNSWEVKCFNSGTKGERPRYHELYLVFRIFEYVHLIYTTSSVASVTVQTILSTDKIDANKLKKRLHKIFDWPVVYCCMETCVNLVSITGRINVVNFDGNIQITPTWLIIIKWFLLILSAFCQPCRCIHVCRFSVNCQLQVPFTLLQKYSLCLRKNMYCIRFECLSFLF